MDVVIRVDASLQMGTGHVMRCVTLAKGLKKKGADVRFICREHIGNLVVFIQNQGFEVFNLALKEHSIETNRPGRHKKELLHAPWLSASQLEDAEECQRILSKINPNWLIVDHYAIDQVWEVDLRPYYQKLMVIDDLADRVHQCDILLDQTFGRVSKAYDSLTPDHCLLLLGSQYALLRPEFMHARMDSLLRRTVPEFKHVLITMGGVDLANDSQKILNDIVDCSLPLSTKISVVVGSGYPYLDTLRLIAEAHPHRIDIKVNVSNIAELMATADVAIGAAGSSTWERCCLGLPSILKVVAENQKIMAQSLYDINAIELLTSNKSWDNALQNAVDNASKRSLVSASLTDGQGVKRVCEYVLNIQQEMAEVMLKPAGMSDCGFCLGLQTPQARKYSRNTCPPDWLEHKAWYQNTLEGSETVLFIIQLDSVSVGTLRVDNVDHSEIEISIIISQNYIGQGLAKKSLNMLFKLLPGKKFKAIIHKDNKASLCLFTKIGFKERSVQGLFIEFIL